MVRQHVSAEQKTVRGTKVPWKLEFRVEWRGRRHFTSHPIQTLPVINSLSYQTHLFLKSPCGFVPKHRTDQVLLTENKLLQVTLQFIMGCILFNLKIFSLDSPPLLPQCIHVLLLCQLHLILYFFLSIPPPLGTSSLSQMHFFLYKDVSLTTDILKCIVIGSKNVKSKPVKVMTTTKSSLNSNWKCYNCTCLQGGRNCMYAATAWITWWFVYNCK